MRLSDRVPRRVDAATKAGLLDLIPRHGRTFLDRELYLPKVWTEDPERCAKAGIPLERGFATKPELALDMIVRAVDAGVPAKWVAGDAV